MSFFSRDIVYSPAQLVGEYTVVKIMGEGRFGICYLVSDGKNQFILKQLKKRMLKSNWEKVGYEEEILKKLNNEFIPKFIDKIEVKGFYGYLLEFKEGITFEELIFEREKTFTQTEIFDIGLRIINILKYIHGTGIVHRDIRIPNTLYDNGRIYMVDFGLARFINDKRYTVEVDFSYLGDFLIHLYYTGFQYSKKLKKAPWFEELDLSKEKIRFLRKLMGLDKIYASIIDVERDFRNLLGTKEE